MSNKSEEYLRRLQEWMDEEDAEKELDVAFFNKRGLIPGANRVEKLNPDGSRVRKDQNAEDS